MATHTPLKLSQAQQATSSSRKPLGRLSACQRTVSSTSHSPVTNQAKVQITLYADISSCSVTHSVLLALPNLLLTLCEKVVFDAGLIHAGSLLTLQGAGAYDAAVHCASVSAARRILQQQQNPDSALPQSMHSIQGQRHYDATQPIPVQVPHPVTNNSPAPSASTPPAAENLPRSSSRGRKRWTGITRRMRTALCEMWTPNTRQTDDSADHS